MADSTSAAEPAPRQASAVPQPTLANYAAVTGLLACFGVALYVGVARAAASVRAPEALLGPIFALAALVGLVWLLMVSIRNYAVLRNIADATYYAAYQHSTPPDWVERPARTFNNLMQIPTMFWLVCVLMMITSRVDGAQLLLAWVFVSARALHALVYMIWNYLPARFGIWTAGTITLVVIWVRFAMHSWSSLVAYGS
jgi:hypothetical protein